MMKISKRFLSAKFGNRQLTDSGTVELTLKKITGYVSTFLRYRDCSARQPKMCVLWCLEMQRLESPLLERVLAYL